MNEKMCNYFYPNQTFTLFPNRAINKTINVLFIEWQPYIMKYDVEENGKISKYRICGPLLALVREFMIKAGVK